MLNYLCTCHSGSPKGFDTSNAHKLENFSLMETPDSLLSGMMLSQSEIAGSPQQIFCDRSRLLVWIVSSRDALQIAHVIDASDLPSGRFELLEAVAKAGKGIPVHCLFDEPVDTHAPGDQS